MFSFFVDHHWPLMTNKQTKTWQQQKHCLFYGFLNFQFEKNKFYRQCFCVFFLAVFLWILRGTELIKYSNKTKNKTVVVFFKQNKGFILLLLNFLNCNKMNQKKPWNQVDFNKKKKKKKTEPKKTKKTFEFEWVQLTKLTTVVWI